MRPEAGLEKYVDPVRVPDYADQDMMTFWTDLRPRALNYWLRNLQSSGHDPGMLGPQSESFLGIDRGESGKKKVLKAVS